MKGKKRLSPFQALIREIENYVLDLQLEAQIHASQNEDLDLMFALGQRDAVYYILQKARAIHERSHFDEPISVIRATDAEDFLRQAMEKEGS